MFWSKADALELIGLTYSLLDEEDGYKNLFARLTDLFGESKYALQMWDEHITVETDRMILSGWDMNGLAPYVEYYSSINPYLPLIGERASGDVYLLDEILPPEVSVRHEFVNDFHHVNGNYAGVTATILKEPNRYGALSVDGPAYSQPHWEELKALIKVLTPHLQRVMQLSRKLHSVSLLDSIASVSMDRAAASIMVVDTNGRLAYANSNAMSLLSEGSVLRTGVGGLLVASTPDQTRELRKLISNSTDGDSIETTSAGGFVMFTNHEGHQMVALVTRLEGGIRKQMGLVNNSIPQNRYAAIFFADPSSRVRLPSELLILQYQLTKTEADLALHLYEGGTLASYCETHFVTLNTARTQLKAIFRKTGVRRQGELVAVLNRLRVFAERGDQLPPEPARQ